MMQQHMQKCAKSSGKVQSMQAKSPIQNNHSSRTHKSKQNIIVIMQRKHVEKRTRTQR